MNTLSRWATVASRQNAIVTVVLETVTRHCIMQQATAVQVATTPVAVTLPPNQIPVAQYVSVSGAKQDLTSSDGDKHLATQNTRDTSVYNAQEARTAIIRRTTPPPKYRIIDFNNESEVASQILKFKQETEEREDELTRALNSAGVRLGDRVLTLADFELAASGDDVDANQVYQGAQIQYIDSSGDHGYANGSGASSYQYTDETQLYTNSHSQNPNSTTNALFFNTSPAIGHQATMVSSLPSHHGHIQAAAGHHNVGQIVATPAGGAYIIRTQPGAGGGEGILAMPLPHSTRASPATVSWLVEHFENSEGVSLPRALMYHHYLLHCREQSLDPVNAASFGKLVRSVFTGLRTRRLGTRGNSKYHYYGIRIKATSPLSRMQEDISFTAMRHPGTHAKRAKSSHPSEKMDTTEGTDSPGPNVAEQVQHHQKFLGDVSQAVPDLDPIQINLQNDPLPNGITQEDISSLEDLYRDHCSSLLDIVVTLQFQMVDDLWHAFWRSVKPIDPSDLMNDEFESKLSHDKLITLCDWAPVQKWVGECDHLMYQSLVDVLIPDVLRPIPSALTQAIRNFAKGLDGNLAAALGGGSIPESMVKIKLTAVSAFSQTLRRYTSLNHLAQAARAVLHNTNQITQMLSDLNRVDFSNVQEQASWVCQCDGAIVKRLEKEFKEALSEQRTLEQWAEWLDSVVIDILKPHELSADINKAARQFLLKWCFYSSMVIRDLTLRSAASFGSFHLIRLLYDEYMFYLVEHRVAQATGDTPIAVMSNFASLSGASSGMDAQGQLESKIKKGEVSFLSKVSPS